MKNLIWSLLVLFLLAGTSYQESFDIEAEKKVIRDMVATAFKAEQQKDMNTLLNYYSEDVIVQLPNMPRIQGREALKKFYYEFFKILVSIEGGSIEVRISEDGDMAWDYGWNRSVVNGHDGPIEDKGKYLSIYKKINEEWKCVAISSSSDKPEM
ncbi:MAG: YybH family protein [Bacteroidota bacterium]